MTSALDSMTVNTYGFNVPCRRFLITVNLTRDRRMPVVDEFYLRALKLSERVSMRRLGAFFGFSEAETEIVTSDLAARGLVEVDVDAVSLHPSARELFQSSGGDIPRIIEIETSVEHVWFDLVSRNIMRAERSRPGRHLIEVKPEGVAREMPAAFARAAFEQNFAEYMRTVRRMRDPDGVGLYSVSSVEAGRFGYVVVRGREDLLLDPAPKLDPHILEVDPSSVGRFRPLSDALWDAYRRLTSAGPSATSLAEFGRLASDDSVAGEHGSDGLFDLRGWYDRGRDWAPAERQPIIGATYINRNAEFFLKLIENRGLPAGAATTGTLELAWFRPTGTYWGASPDLEAFISGIRGALGRISRTVKLRTSLIIPYVSRAEDNRRFERLFDEAYVANAGHLSPGVEVLLLRNIGAIAAVPVRLSDQVSVPVGFVLLEPKVLAVLERLLKPDEVRKSSPLWHRAPKDDDEDA